MFKKLLFILTLFSAPLIFSCENQSLKITTTDNSKAMSKGISTLNADNNFTFIDLGLSQENLDFIKKNLKIKVTEQYSRFGNLILLKDELPAFLRKIGNNDEKLIELVTEIIYQIALDVAEACNKETAWVCIRASTPTDDYDMPRWHTDGNYYGPCSEPSIKFAAALQGNQTLFYRLPKDLRKQFNQNYDNRNFLSELLDLKKSVSPKQGDGALFIVGNQECAAIHSEPPINEERLFFSILPGNDTEINKLYLRWHPNNKAKYWQILLGPSII